MDRFIKKSSGYSLVEVMTAMAIMGIVALLVGTVLTTSTKMHRTSFSSDDAYAIAREKLAEFQQNGVIRDSVGSDTVPRNRVDYYRSWLITQDTAATAPVMAVINVAWLQGSVDKKIQITGYIQGELCGSYLNNTPPYSLVIDSSKIPKSSGIGAYIGQFSATDDQSDSGDMIFYEFTTGDSSTDNSKFSLSNGKLRTAQNIALAGKYYVRIKASDCADTSTEKGFMIQVENIYAVPTISDNTLGSIPENSAINTLLPDDLAATGGGLSYSILSSTNFGINGAGKIKVIANMDYEDISLVNPQIFKVIVTNSSGSDTATITVPITDVNEAPTNITLSYDSLPTYSPLDFLIGKITAVDPDAGDVISYSTTNYLTEFKAGPTDSTFSTAMVNNVPGTYNVDFTVTDAGNLSFSKTIPVTVVNHTPTVVSLTGTVFTPPVTNGDLLATISTSDSDVLDTHVYTKSGTDEAKFSISGNSLYAAADLNIGTYNLTVTATDNWGAYFSQAYVILVNSNNSAPTNILLSNNNIDDVNAITGATIGNLTTSDPNGGDTHTYLKDGGADAASFTIVGSTLKLASGLSAGTYYVNIKSTDNGIPNLSLTMLFTITINDATTPTNITLNNNIIDENYVAGTSFGKFTTTDPDNSTPFVYSFGGGADDGLFGITGDSLTVGSSSITQGSYNIKIVTTDATSKTYMKSFVITVNAGAVVNLAPTNITLSTNSINDDALLGTVIGYFTTTDPDNNSPFTYTLASGTGDTDNGKFSILGDNLKTGIYPISAGTYSIRVRTTDSGVPAKSFVKNFSIIVNATSGPSPCDGIATWSGGSVSGGTKVVYSGKLYQAKFWTSQTPGGSDWDFIVFCSTPPCSDYAAWSSSTVYNTLGTLVYYNGVIYSNTSWWQSNKVPPSNPGVWDVIGPCN